MSLHHHSTWMALGRSQVAFSSIPDDNSLCHSTSQSNEQVNGGGRGSGLAGHAGSEDMHVELIIVVSARSN